MFQSSVLKSTLKFKCSFNTMISGGNGQRPLARHLTDRHPDTYLNQGVQVSETRRKNGLCGPQWPSWRAGHCRLALGAWPFVGALARIDSGRSVGALVRGRTPAAATLHSTLDHRTDRSDPTSKTDSSPAFGGKVFHSPLRWLTPTTLCDRTSRRFLS